MENDYNNFIQAEKHQLRLFSHTDSEQIPMPPASVSPARITEVEGDLFLDAPPEASLAHCVGADLRMGAGIAVEFRERYGNLHHLRSLGRGPGQVATLPLFKPNGQIDKYIFNVVTKPRSANCLPRPEEFRPAVHELAQLCKSLGVATLAMP